MNPRPNRRIALGYSSTCAGSRSSLPHADVSSYRRPCALALVAEKIFWEGEVGLCGKCKKPLLLIEQIMELLPSRGSVPITPRKMKSSLSPATRRVREGKRVHSVTNPIGINVDVVFCKPINVAIQKKLLSNPSRWWLPGLSACPAHCFSPECSSMMGWLLYETSPGDAYSWRSALPSSRMDVKSEPQHEGIEERYVGDLEEQVLKLPPLPLASAQQEHPDAPPTRGSLEKSTRGFDSLSQLASSRTCVPWSRGGRRMLNCRVSPRSRHFVANPSAHLGLGSGRTPRGALSSAISSGLRDYLPPLNQRDLQKCLLAPHSLDRHIEEGFSKRCEWPPPTVALEIGLEEAVEDQKESKVKPSFSKFAFWRSSKKERARGAMGRGCMKGEMKRVSRGDACVLRGILPSAT